MAGYLIAEEGPLTGLVVKLEEGVEWVLGRDPEASSFVLEDPMVSRKHVICRLTPEGYFLENLSAVNPATQNGKIIAEPVLLQEGDIIQIGNTFFHFSEKNPVTLLTPSKEETTFLMDGADELASLNMSVPTESKWLIKVITGPNTGAEFQMQSGQSYVVGKDPVSCAIVFQDLSVSKEHARLTVDGKENLFVEDLGSRNGTFVNAVLLKEKTQLSSQDLIVIGTTSFMVVDRKQNLETLISAPPVPEKKEEPSSVQENPQPVPLNVRDLVISKKYLALGGVLSFILLLSLVGVVSLFQSEPLPAPPKHEADHIRDITQNYSAIQFSYNEGSGKLFLTGHVPTSVDKQELVYQLRRLSFLKSLEDSVVIDELVCQNMNALLITNPHWQGIAIYAPQAGRFAVRGYLQTVEEAQALSDYLNINFPYLDKLENQVVVENTLTTQIESALLEKGFNNVTYQLSNGEVVLAGRVDSKEEAKFDSLLKEFKTIPGIRSLKNYVIYSSEDSSLVDLSSQYKVLGFSKKDGENTYVVINGKILSIGDSLDGMMITLIQANMVLLEKDGLKFKINYNLQ